MPRTAATEAPGSIHRIQPSEPDQQAPAKQLFRHLYFGCALMVWRT